MTTETMLSIRRARRSDADELWRMYSAVIQDGTTFHADESVGRQEIVDEWLAGKGWAHLACFHHDVFGAYLLKPNARGRGSHIANATYLVDAAQRGRGVGRALAEHSLEFAKDAGFTAMQFNQVVRTNEAALRLWLDLGFEIVGRVPGGFRHPNGEFVDVLIMHRFL